MAKNYVQIMDKLNVVQIRAEGPGGRTDRAEGPGGRTDRADGRTRMEPMGNLVGNSIGNWINN